MNSYYRPKNPIKANSRSNGTKNRGLFWPHMHSILYGIKRSWHPAEGISVIVVVERVSVTYR